MGSYKAVLIGLRQDNQYAHLVLDNNNVIPLPIGKKDKDLQKIVSEGDTIFVEEEQGELKNIYLRNKTNLFYPFPNQ